MDMPNFPFNSSPRADVDPSSFSAFLRSSNSELLPKIEQCGQPEAPHGTTIVALKHSGGVMIAGDRRATEGYSVAHRSIEKVFKTDRLSAVAIAGSAGPAIEMTKLFQTELEHYEKIEGERLSLEGQANKLGQMIRANLPMAMQGLAVVPLFAGFDERLGAGRIFKYDITGGRYEESEYWATGSGGRDARASVKKRYRPDLTVEQATKVAIEALFDASEEDVGTGGPDVLRHIYPNIASITTAGFKEISDDQIAARFQDLLEERASAPSALSEEHVPGQMEGNGG
ncbi:MAG: proteasome subunit beta [Actinomycetota bacterium]